MGINGRSEPRPRYVVLPEEVLDLHDWDEYLSLLDETGPFKCLRSSTSFVLPEEVPDLHVWDEYLCFADGVQKQRSGKPPSSARHSGAHGQHAEEHENVPKRRPCRRPHSLPSRPWQGGSTSTAEAVLAAASESRGMATPLRRVVHREL